MLMNINSVNHLRNCSELDGTAFATRVFLITALWLENSPLVPTGNAAAAIAGCSRPLIDCARVIIESDDGALIAASLAGRIALTAAAARVRRRVALVKSFKSASADDRASLSKVFGATQLFDSMIAPSL